MSGFFVFVIWIIYFLVRDKSKISSKQKITQSVFFPEQGLFTLPLPSENASPILKRKIFSFKRILYVLILSALYALLLISIEIGGLKHFMFSLNKYSDFLPNGLLLYFLCLVVAVFLFGWLYTNRTGNRVALGMLIVMFAFFNVALIETKFSSPYFKLKALYICSDESHMQLKKGNVPTYCYTMYTKLGPQMIQFQIADDELHDAPAFNRFVAHIKYLAQKSKNTEAHAATAIPPKTHRRKPLPVKGAHRLKRYPTASLPVHMNCNGTNRYFYPCNQQQ